MIESMVQNKSVDFCAQIFSFFPTLKSIFPEISSQLIRSATSIGANIAEAQSAESKKDFIHKLSIALKEARETYFWLRVLDKTEKFETTQTLIKLCNEICALLASSLKTLKNEKTNSEL